MPRAAHSEVINHLLRERTGILARHGFVLWELLYAGNMLLAGFGNQRSGLMPVPVLAPPHGLPASPA